MRGRAAEYQQASGINSARFVGSRVLCMSMRRSFIAIVFALMSAGFPATAQTHTTPRTVPYFEFHNSFWLNLHQTLFCQASTSIADEVPAKSSAWELALKFYKDHFTGHSLLFDPQLVEVNNWLATQPDEGKILDPSGLPPDLPPDLGKILQAAAGTYRIQWVTASSQNELWITKMEAGINALAPSIVPQLEAALGMPWPQQPIRVDVSNCVREIGGAYTTDDPPHTTISSRDEKNQNIAGVEIMFHEATHTMAGKTERAISSECAAQKKDCRDLWHAVLFYTVGNAMKNSLPKDEKATFVPYAYRFGLYNRGAWKIYRIALEKDWQPCLDGKTAFADAVRSLVRDI